MANDISKLMEFVKASKPGDDRTMTALLQAVEALSNMVKLLMLDKQLGDLSSKIGILTGTEAPVESEQDLSEALDNLQEIVPFTKDQKTGKRSFLLYRLTQENEYENSAEGSNEYETAKETEWQTNEMVADHEQDVSEITQGVTPVVACWIDEDKIKDIPKSPENTGIWGQLGRNPQGSKYIIIVKPGKFQVHSEVRQ